MMTLRVAAPARRRSREAVFEPDMETWTRGSLTWRWGGSESREEEEDLGQRKRGISEEGVRSA